MADALRTTEPVAERPMLAREAAALLEEVTGEPWPMRRLYRCVERGYVPARRIGWSVRFLRNELIAWWTEQRGTSPLVLDAERESRKDARVRLGLKRVSPMRGKKRKA
jgi:hypothetical protein